MNYRVCMIVLQDYLRDARVKRYAESLADAGAKVDIICVKSRQATEPIYRNDIRIYRIPLGHGAHAKLGYPIEYCLAILLFSLWMTLLYARNRYQAIHVHNMPDALVFCALLPRLCGAKILLDVHDPMPEFYASKFASAENSFAATLLRFEERISASCAHRIIAANKNFREKLVARGVPADKAIVVNNIADTRIFSRSQHPRSTPICENPKDRPFTLIFAGTIAPRYGLEVAVRAAVQLRHVVPTLLIRIVGRQNDHADELARLAGDLRVGEHVEFVREVAVHEVPKFLAEADIGIYPARSDPHMDIATPTKVLECAQMGLPVVASRLPVLQQYFDETSVRFVRPGDVEDFVTAIRELWYNPGARQTLVDHADRRFVANHDWRNEEAAYFDMLAEVLDR